MRDVPFGGLEILALPELTPFESATECVDCYIDRNGITPRPGYRVVTSGLATPPKFLARFRPSLTQAKTVAVSGGNVYVIDDPAAINGDSLSTPNPASANAFPATSGSYPNVSGAQLFENLYLISDQVGNMVRVNQNFAVETRIPIPAGSIASVQQNTSITWTTFKSMQSASNPTCSTSPVCVARDNSVDPWRQMPSTWIGFSGTNPGDDPSPGAWAAFQLPAAENWTGYDWVVVALSPQTNGGGNNNGEVSVQVTNSATLSGAAWTTIGYTRDTPAWGGSPCYVFCPIQTLDSTIKSNITFIRFLITASQVGGKFMVYGYAKVPAAPLQPTYTYYVDFYNSANGEASPQSQPFTVNVSNSTIAQFPDAFMDNGVANTTGANVDPLNPAWETKRLFNWGSKDASLPFPDPTQIGSTITLSGTVPNYNAQTLTVRLWRAVSNSPQPRLVAQKDYAPGSTWTITDPGGTGVLNAQVYKPGGAIQQATAMAAIAGRLVAAYQNRIMVSSFTPLGNATTHPWPQFPSIPYETADGWQFDLANLGEQVIALVAGDTLYILTNLGLKVLDNLDAPLDRAPDIYPVFNRGCVGKNAAIYAESSLFWCAYDGIYAAQGRTTPQELSLPIRQYILDTFQPDSTVVLSYHNRCLYVTKGTQALRYSFVTGRWSRINWSDTISCATFWLELPNLPATAGDNMWFLTSAGGLMRYQTDTVRDGQSGTDTTTGTAIPDWTYRTGVAFNERPFRVVRFYADVTGPVQVAISPSFTPREPCVTLTPENKVFEVPYRNPAYTAILTLTGKSTALVNRFMWEVEPRDVISPKVSP